MNTASRTAPEAAYAFTQTAHADTLRQLWDIATVHGAGKEQQ